MRLKKLEMSGFKSFAKTTVLEFPSRVTAIVGPNGSGKSNVKDAIQWVLGEQSMKSLRGKKGEDLVWNGSPEVPRMGKAAVTLVFDNADKKISPEFDEVSIQRKIFRDGAGEYAINHSPVRLKDITELCAQMGLGESKHNIIGQGEVDRVLLAFPKDRYRMLEEALGLRVYHLKKNETERKLTATEQNMVQVEAVMREIVPHLKFLRASSEKAGMRGRLEAELRAWELDYFTKEEKEIAHAKARVAMRRVPLSEHMRDIQKEIARLTRELAEAEQALAPLTGVSEAEKNLGVLEEKRRELERSIGRLEGRMEAEKEKGDLPDERSVDVQYLHEEIQKILAAARIIVKEESRLEVMRSRMAAFCDALARLTGEIARGRSGSAGKKVSASPAVREITAGISAAQAQLVLLENEMQEYARMREQEHTTMAGQQASIRTIDGDMRKKQDSARDAAMELQKIGFEEERIRAREDDFARELAAAGMSRADLASHFASGSKDTPQEELFKKIQRNRMRLEEIGAIDPGMLKEYEETEARHAFLARELADLKSASASLKELIKELDRHIKKDFREGFAKIKDAFGEYFRLIFGGGKASLVLVRQESRSTNQGEEEDEETGTLDESGDQESEDGVEIMVELPRKRIRGLAMLSGGERALASLALLFAISAVNPPPFLILDETDAALDEANSERFGALLGELSQKTQLLVITHNRETMKSAGILYGVTLGHDGVSKLLSLKLEQAEAYTHR